MEHPTKASEKKSFDSTLCSSNQTGSSYCSYMVSDKEADSKVQAAKPMAQQPHAAQAVVSGLFEERFIRNNNLQNPHLVPSYSQSSRQLEAYVTIEFVLVRSGNACLNFMTRFEKFAFLRSSSANRV